MSSGSHPAKDEPLVQDLEWGRKRSTGQGRFPAPLTWKPRRGSRPSSRERETESRISPRLRDELRLARMHASIGGQRTGRRARR
jgi:hypothetical protein